MHHRSQTRHAHWLLVALVATAFAFAGGRFSHLETYDGHKHAAGSVSLSTDGHLHAQPGAGSELGDAGEIHCGAPVLSAPGGPNVGCQSVSLSYAAMTDSNVALAKTTVDPPPPRPGFKTV